MNAVESFVCRRLADGLHPLGGRLHRAVVRQDRADDFHELHQRHRVEEVKPEHLRRPPVAAAIAVTLHEEVFDARIACSAQILWAWRTFRS
jgi:hypothetical protein